MNANELVQFLYDYGNISSRLFHEKYPEIIADRDKIAVRDGLTNREATLEIVLKIANDIIESQEAPAPAQEAAGD